MKNEYLPLVYLAITQVLDAWSTIIFLGLGIKEANPIILKMVDFFGSFKTALLAKGLFVVAIGCVLLQQPYGHYMVWALIGFYDVIVLWNVYCIHKAKKKP